MPEPRVKDVSVLEPWYNATAQMEFRMENDADGDPLYIGLARPGSATSDAVWHIRKVSYDGNGYISRIQFPDDNPRYEFIWDNRASLSYTA